MLAEVRSPFWLDMSLKTAVNKFNVTKEDWKIFNVKNGGLTYMFLPFPRECINHLPCDINIQQKLHEGRFYFFFSFFFVLNPKNEMWMWNVTTMAILTGLAVVRNANLSCHLIKHYCNIAAWGTAWILTKGDLKQKLGTQKFFWSS